MNDEPKNVFKEVENIIDRIETTLATSEDNYMKWKCLSQDCDAIFDRLSSLTPEQMDLIRGTPEVLEVMERVILIKRKLQILVGARRPEAKA